MLYEVITLVIDDLSTGRVQNIDLFLKAFLIKTYSAASFGNNDDNSA